MFDKITQDTHYQGIPLATGQGPFLQMRLADALVTIESIMERSNRIIASSIEVLVPDKTGFGYSLYDDPVPQFVAKLQKQARWKHTDLHGNRKRRGIPIIEGIWQEVITPNGKTSYRILLLLNREAYDEQSVGFDAANTLQFRARNAWAKIMHIPQNYSGAYIRFPYHGLLITNNSAEGFCEVFERASVLCAVPNPVPGRGQLGFGSTQKAIVARKHILPAKTCSTH